jgi:hypothetical protein
MVASGNSEGPVSRPLGPPILRRAANLSDHRAAAHFASAARAFSSHQTGGPA